VWNRRPYFWVVTCKNHRFHQKDNFNYRHHILLGQANFYASLPRLPDQVKVRCDSCGFARVILMRKSVNFATCRPEISPISPNLPILQ